MDALWPGIGLDSTQHLATGLAVVKHMDHLSGQPSFREYSQTEALWVAYRKHDSSGLVRCTGLSWQLDRDPHEVCKPPVGFFMFLTLSGPIWSTDDCLEGMSLKVTG